MRHALVKDGLVVRVFRRPEGFLSEGTNYPKEVFSLWTDAERAEIGIVPVTQKNGRSTPYHRDVGDDGGVVLPDGTVKLTIKYASDSLALVKDSLIRKLEIASSAAKEKNSPLGGCSFTEHEELLREIKGFQLNNGGIYPLLAQEAKELGGDPATDMAKTATFLHAKHSKWVLTMVRIRTIVLDAKARIDMAKTVNAAVSATSDIVWP